MVEANEDSPLGGGIPSDNNTIEGGMNCGDKAFQNQEHYAAVGLTKTMVSCVWHHSVNDLRFNGELKSKANKAGDVHSGNVYNAAHLMTEHYKEGKATCLDLQFGLTNAMHGIKGHIVCSDSFLASLKEMGVVGVDALKQCIHNPQCFCQEKGFNKATDTICSFHFLSSLDLTDNPNMKATIHELHGMLEFNGLRMMPYDDILELQDEGLVSCTCHCYFLHGWCKHAAVHAWKRAVFLNFPKTKDPTIADKAKTGQPGKSKLGEALCRHNNQN